MGHCDSEVMQHSSSKFMEKDIETKAKDKVNNNTYDKIKHIVKSQGENTSLDKNVVNPDGVAFLHRGNVKSRPQKNKININL
jgi:hypothetical protein